MSKYVQTATFVGVGRKPQQAVDEAEDAMNVSLDGALMKREDIISMSSAITVAPDGSFVFTLTVTYETVVRYANKQK